MMLSSSLPSAMQPKAEQQGWTRQIYSCAKLEENAKFKGRVDTDDCTFFHNGIFSNWWLTIPEPHHKKEFATIQFVVNFNGVGNISFLTAEGFLMLFKERSHEFLNNVVTEFAPRAVAYGQMNGRIAKKEAGRYFTVQFWDHHTFQVLINTIACLFKFTQGTRGEGQELLCTKRIIIEAAPADGSFGVAANTATFLSNREQPEKYHVLSVDDSLLSFTIANGPHKGKQITRPCRHANALGKSLQLCKAIMEQQGAGAIYSMQEALDVVTAAMASMGVFADVDVIATALKQMYS